MNCIKVTFTIPKEIEAQLTELQFLMRIPSKSKIVSELIARQYKECTRKGE